MKFLGNIELEIKKSKFLAYSYEVVSANEVALIISDLKQQHKKAKHFCYAYILENPYQEKCSDDGEPSGTAGKPILNVLQKKLLKNKLICIVRYFGGIKLGAGGLVRAYTKAASMVAENFKKS